MHASDQRRLVAREIADRLSRGLGSLYLVSAPSVPGVWSLGPALASDVADLLLEVRTVEVDAEIGCAPPADHPGLDAADVLLSNCMNQVIEKLCQHREQADLCAGLESLRMSVKDGATVDALSDAATDLAAAFSGPPVLVVVSARGMRDQLSTTRMRKVASLLATTPLAIVVLLPEGDVGEVAEPPLFTASIRHLGPDDVRDLIGAQTAAYVDPLVAGWISRSTAGRIADIRAQGAAMSGAALAGRELPWRVPTVSEPTRREAAERLVAMEPARRDAVVAMHLQLIPDVAAVREATGTVPPPEAEDLQPDTNPAPGLAAALGAAVVQAVPREVVRNLHEALADSYRDGTRERSWHRLEAGGAAPDDLDRLLAAAATELQHGSLNTAWRIVDALDRNRSAPDLCPDQEARIRLLRGHLALQLGCTLTASSCLLQAMGWPGLSPQEELTAIAGYITARGCEGVSVEEDSRLAARIAELGAVEPLPAARCLILLASQERLVGAADGPRDYLHTAIKLLDTDTAKERPGSGNAGALALAQALAARVDGDRGSVSNNPLTGVFVDIPGDTARGDVAVWAQAVIHAVLAAEDLSAERPVFVESMQSRLAGASPFYEAQAVSLRAYLNSRLGWTGYAQAELISDGFRVPLRAGLTGLGMAMAAQGAMLFGGEASATAWRAAMAGGLPGSAASPQQLWVGVLEAAARLASGDGSLAGLLLGPTVSAAVPRERLRAVWSSVVDMVIIEPALLERVPGLAAWLRAQAGGRMGPDPDDGLLTVLLSDDAEAIPLISRLLLEAACSGNAVRQVRADMVCAARLRRSPGLDPAELGMCADAVSCAQALVARATELAADNSMFFWRRVTERAGGFEAGDGASSMPAVVSITPPELTDTELRVARLAARGRRNKEIAAETYMAVRTVELRLTGVYRALGISSRKDLPKALALHGLLDD
ncbi:helix-turn-helix transcriptional regulator [Actinomyces sp.]|uniref:helix-turn-helix transcriptional regulator n=1 Tax=Actinomyces sp. TaxID=29317 RepID=UPI0026DD2CCC|nr:helix-turn-helix transcriptional regulator [Actinomyces sp.]MDO4901851.1 helix-turn-helix transcriptional regulator [Actinomyces sp.]